MIGVLSVGDTVRFKGRGEVRAAAPWRTNVHEMRKADWVVLQAREALTIVGPVPYRCSFEWVLLRHTQPESSPDRWILGRDSDLTRDRRSWETCVGQTAVVEWTKPYYQGVSPGEVVLVLDKVRSMVESVLVSSGDSKLQVEFGCLRILVEEPLGYARPNHQRQGGET